MPVEQFITTVFCIVDDLLKELFPTPLRSRGFPPKLSDSEVITMEVTGEWLGHHADKHIWEYFMRHWQHLFPDLTSRSAFIKQAANLWAVKQKLQTRLVQLTVYSRTACQEALKPIPTPHTTVILAQAGIHLAADSLFRRNDGESE